MSKENKAVSEDWAEFFVASGAKSESGREYYETYKLYKEQLKELPKSELIKRGWLKSKQDSISLVSLFRDIHEDRQAKLYRKSNTADASLTSLWLSKVKVQAEIDYFLNSVPEFQALEKAKLKSIAQLSADVGVLTELKSILREIGIILVFLRPLPSMKLDGAVFKLHSGNPVVGMTLRYSRLDNFWFTLLHELAHISLHMELLETPILEDLDLDSDSDIEISANRLAKKSIVDRHVWRNCPPKYDKGYESINRFAKQIGVHRSIVAGLLRREEGNYAAYSRIVNEINTREVIFGHD